jgi:hypothetical protein
MVGNVGVLEVGRRADRGRKLGAKTGVVELAGIDDIRRQAGDVSTGLTRPRLSRAYV